MNVVNNNIMHTGNILEFGFISVMINIFHAFLSILSGMVWIVCVWRGMGGGGGTQGSLLETWDLGLSLKPCSALNLAVTLSETVTPFFKFFFLIHGVSVIYSNQGENI